MHFHSRIPRAALWLVAVAGWAILSSSACAPSAIDGHRSSFVAPPAAAAQAAAEARLAVVHYQARHGLNVKAGASPRPAGAHGAVHEAYQRWMKGEVRELPDSASQAGQ